jgi:hypothetical protein
VQVRFELLDVVLQVFLGSILSNRFGRNLRVKSDFVKFKFVIMILN